MKTLQVTIALSVALLCGCDSQQLMRKFVSPADEQAASTYIELLRHRDFERIERDIDPTLGNDGLHRTLTAMAALIPAGEPLSAKLVGAQTTRLADSSNTNITYEFQYPSAWLLASVAVKKSHGVATIIGFHVQPLKDSLEHANRFTLTGKTPLAYVVLVLALVIPVFILYVLVVAIRTPGVPRKWLWISFILFGVSKLAVNWTTGEWSYQVLAVQLLGAAVASPFYGPWTLAISSPLD